MLSTGVVCKALFSSPLPHEEPAAKTRKNTPSTEHTQNRDSGSSPARGISPYSARGPGAPGRRDPVPCRHHKECGKSVQSGVPGLLCLLLTWQEQGVSSEPPLPICKMATIPPPAGLRCVWRAFAVASARLALGLQLSLSLVSVWHFAADEFLGPQGQLHSLVRLCAVGELLSTAVLPPERTVWVL